MIQFVQNGKRYTYLPEYPTTWMSGDDGMNVIARFWVKIKDNRNWLEKMLDFGRRRRYLSNHLIGNQIHELGK